jgi:hypothetical protein
MSNQNIKIPTKVSCQNYRSDLSIDKNFYFINGHGEELSKDYKIQKGVRIIMFCYSGRILDVCKKFDRFNWGHILLDPSISENYCTFLSAISEYPSIRDHFCVYEEGDTIKDIELYPDKNFRAGLYKLPVKGYSYEGDTNTIRISSNMLMSDIQNDAVLSSLLQSKNVSVDDKKIVDIAKNNSIEYPILAEIIKPVNTNQVPQGKHLSDILRKNNLVNAKTNAFGIIKEGCVKAVTDKIKLSNLLGSILLQFEEPFTVLVMVCRESIGYTFTVSPGTSILDELKKL